MLEALYDWKQVLVERLNNSHNIELDEHNIIEEIIEASDSSWEVAKTCQMIENAEMVNKWGDDLEEII
jgi:tellurite resistance protein